MVEVFFEDKIMELYQSDNTIRNFLDNSTQHTHLRMFENIYEDLAFFSITGGSNNLTYKLTLNKLELYINKCPTNLEERNNITERFNSINNNCICKCKKIPYNFISLNFHTTASWCTIEFAFNGKNENYEKDITIICALFDESDINKLMNKLSSLQTDIEGRYLNIDIYMIQNNKYEYKINKSINNIIINHVKFLENSIGNFNYDMNNIYYDINISQVFEQDERLMHLNLSPYASQNLITKFKYIFNMSISNLRTWNDPFNLNNIENNLNFKIPITKYENFIKEIDKIVNELINNSFSKFRIPPSFVIIALTVAQTYFLIRNNNLLFQSHIIIYITVFYSILYIISNIIKVLYLEECYYYVCNEKENFDTIVYKIFNYSNMEYIENNNINNKKRVLVYKYVKFKELVETDLPVLYIDLQFTCICMIEFMYFIGVTMDLYSPDNRDIFKYSNKCYECDKILKILTGFAFCCIVIIIISIIMPIYVIASIFHCECYKNKICYYKSNNPSSDTVSNQDTETLSGDIERQLTSIN